MKLKAIGEHMNKDPELLTQHARAPTRFPIPVETTLFKLLPEASPKIVRSICVALSLRRFISSLPSVSIMAWAMYSELLSFSEKPRETTMPCFEAHS